MNGYEVFSFRDNKSSDPLNFSSFQDGQYISAAVMGMLQIDPLKRPSASALLEVFFAAHRDLDANR